MSNNLNTGNSGIAVRVPLLKAQQSVKLAMAASKAVFSYPQCGPATETTIVHIVSDDDDLAARVHYTPQKALCQTVSGNGLIGALERRLDRIFSPKKTQLLSKEVELLNKAEDPESWLQFSRCSEIPENLFPINPVRSVQDDVVLYHKNDYKQLYQAVVEAGASGAFIVCVDDENAIPEVARMFADFSSVDVITRATCISDDFSFVLLSSVLKRALREVGFMD